jgi:hypothetical protein
MSELNNPQESAELSGGDKRISVPALNDAAAIASATRGGQSARAVRRRFSVTHLAPPVDDGFRPFRVY